MAAPVMNVRKPFIVKSNMVNRFERSSNKKEIESIIANASKFERNNEKLKKDR